MSRQSTVYIVDDDQATRESVCALVEGLGYRAVPFPTGEAFLSAYDGSWSGCVVTDHRMPGMSGLELQEQLARRGSHLPVIIVSGYANVPVTVRAMRMGAVTLLEKPYQEFELSSAIREALARNEESRQRAEQRAEIRRRVDRLTGDEQKVMRRIVAGRMNKAIAIELGMGKRTVERYRHNVFEKMQVDSVAELARLVAEAITEDDRARAADRQDGPAPPPG